MDVSNKISALLDKNSLSEAIDLATAQIEACADDTDVYYYLRGNAYRKLGNWKRAIEDYLEAIEINPSSPAGEAYEMAMDILQFFNKDMYNQ